MQCSKHVGSAGYIRKVSYFQCQTFSVFGPFRSDLWIERRQWYLGTCYITDAKGLHLQKPSKSEHFASERFGWNRTGAGRFFWHLYNNAMSAERKYWLEGQAFSAESEWSGLTSDRLDLELALLLETYSISTVLAGAFILAPIPACLSFWEGPKTLRML